MRTLTCSLVLWILVSELLLDGAVLAGEFVIHPDYLRHFALNVGSPQAPVYQPFLRVGKSAFYLLDDDHWPNATPSPNDRGPTFVNEAWEQGFNTLRVFLMAWWFGAAEPQINAWGVVPRPGTSWWLTASNSIGHLDQQLDYIEDHHPPITTRRAFTRSRIPVMRPLQSPQPITRSGELKRDSPRQSQ